MNFFLYMEGLVLNLSMLYYRFHITIVTQKSVYVDGIFLVRRYADRRICLVLFVFLLPRELDRNLSNEYLEINIRVCVADDGDISIFFR